MNDHVSILPTALAPTNVLLADDDIDDRYFFDKALKAIPVQTRLTTVEDGEELMTYLSAHYENLPDVLFLDLNMPRKNGSECLKEIKQNEKLKQLIVIILSTSLQEQLADKLYSEGAHYYIRKTDITDLIEKLGILFALVAENKFTRPSRAEYIIDGILKY
jgi:CheY-like chemotaxis protein